MKILDNYQQLFSELVSIIESELAKGSSGALGFCGGRSIRPLYEQLLENPDSISSENWKKLQFFLVDERLVSVGSTESNFLQLEKELLEPLREKSLISSKQSHPALKENCDAESLVELYQDALHANGKELLVAFLGVGEDGHVASLFPSRLAGMSESGINQQDFLLVEDSPKPPARRISASPNLLRRAKHVFLIFSGSAKRQAWDNFNNPELDIDDCPAKLFFGQGNLNCLVNLA